MLVKPEANRREVVEHVAEVSKQAPGASRHVAPVDKPSLSAANSHFAPVDYSLVARDGIQVVPGGSHVVARRGNTEDPCNPKILACIAAGNCPYCFNTDYYLSRPNDIPCSLEMGLDDPAARGQQQ